MTGTLIGYKPDYAVPPGETLVEALEEAELTQAELAFRSGLSPTYVDRLARGHEVISPAVSVKLEDVLGIPSQFWVAREDNYQSQRARLAERQPTAADIAGHGASCTHAAT